MSNDTALTPASIAQCGAFTVKRAVIAHSLAALTPTQWRMLAAARTDAFGTALYEPTHAAMADADALLAKGLLELNHPSADPTISAEGRALTNRVQAIYVEFLGSFTAEGDDDWVCVCGNDACAEGLFLVDDRGADMPLDAPDGRWAELGRYLGCGRCGRYASADQVVDGRVAAAGQAGTLPTGDS